MQQLQYECIVVCDRLQGKLASPYQLYSLFLLLQSKILLICPTYSKCHCFNYTFSYFVNLHSSRKQLTYCSLNVKQHDIIPHSRLITGFVTTVTRRVPIVELEHRTLPEHLRSPPPFNGGSCMLLNHQFSVWCLLDIVFPFFFFGHCIICPSFYGY